MVFLRKLCKRTSPVFSVKPRVLSGAEAKPMSRADEHCCCGLRVFIYSSVSPFI